MKEVAFMVKVQDIDWKDYTEEAKELLTELIQIDTANPPGNETEAAKFLQKLFQKEGIAGEILEPQKGRGSFLARLTGEKTGPKLMLLSHTDVVPVTDPKKWKYPPFSGKVAAGYIWGRGALDMKCMTAMEAMVFLLFKRLKIKFSGELIFAATADEEKGGGLGVGWLVKEHPKKMKADYVLNEGGGMPISINNKTFYTIENVEKGLWWIKVKIKGLSGHGALPHENNALAKGAFIIDRISKHKFPKMISPSVRGFITKIAEAFGSQGRKLAESILDLSKEVDLKKALKDTLLDPNLINAFIRTTVSPTMIHAGIKENVIPDSCEFVLDCRFVPGYSQDEIFKTINELAAGFEEDMEIETLQYHAASESSIDTEFYQILKQTILEELPDVQVVPLMLTGATDSRFLRGLGALSYGFCPLSTKMSLSERAKLIHSDNERIDLESLDLGIRLLTKVALKTLKASI